ncbi:MAG TPA: hypothetical protein VHL09_12570 [Dehalococcoidia bacterium]|nr:hypothetical protein [Dehalococcoidia bacterium]
MTKLWVEGCPIKVRTGPGGLPVQVAWQGRWERIEGIGPRWRIADEWWRRPIHRDYFRVMTRSLIGEIYQDRLTKAWYLERIYD